MVFIDAGDAACNVLEGNLNMMELFVHRAKLLQLVDSKWKDRCSGKAKVLKNTITGKPFFELEEDITSNTGLSHEIIMHETQCVLCPRDGHCVTWFVGDPSTQKQVELQYALEFDDSGTVDKFTDVFNNVRNMNSQVLICSNERESFAHRSKLFVFRDNQWTELGAGEAKILAHKQSGLARFVHINKKACSVIASHDIIEDPEFCRLRPNAGSNCCWAWTAQSEIQGMPGCNRFALRFGTKELAAEFKDAFSQAKIAKSNKDGPLKLSSLDSNFPSSIAKVDKRHCAPISDKETMKQQTSGGAETSKPISSKSQLCNIAVREMGFTLIRCDNNSSREHFVLKPGSSTSALSIGRASSNDVCLSFNGISTLHAEIRLAEQTHDNTATTNILSFHDFSTNGSLLKTPNGVKTILRKGHSALLPDGSKLILPFMTKSHDGIKAYQAQILVVLDKPERVGADEEHAADGCFSIIPAADAKQGDGERRKEDSPIHVVNAAEFPVQLAGLKAACEDTVAPPDRPVSEKIGAPSQQHVAQVQPKVCIERPKDNNDALLRTYPAAPPPLADTSANFPPVAACPPCSKPDKTLVVVSSSLPVIGATRKAPPSAKATLSPPPPPPLLNPPPPPPPRRVVPPVPAPSAHGDASVSNPVLMHTTLSSVADCTVPENKSSLVEEVVQAMSQRKLSRSRSRPSNCIRNEYRSEIRRGKAHRDKIHRDRSYTHEPIRNCGSQGSTAGEVSRREECKNSQAGRLDSSENGRCRKDSCRSDSRGRRSRSNRHYRHRSCSSERHRSRRNHSRSDSRHGKRLRYRSSSCTSSRGRRRRKSRSQTPQRRLRRTVCYTDSRDRRSSSRGRCRSTSMQKDSRKNGSQATRLFAVKSGPKFPPSSYRNSYKN